MFPQVQAQHPNGSQGVVQAVCKGGGGEGGGIQHMRHCGAAVAPEVNWVALGRLRVPSPAPATRASRCP